MLKYFLITIVNVVFSHAYAEKAVAIASFEMKVLSTEIKTECEYNKGDETGILSITYKENELSNIFLVMKGINPQLCKWHEKEIKKILKSPKVALLGRGGNKDLKNNEIVWTWVSIKNEKKCHSYFEADCP